MALKSSYLKFHTKLAYSDDSALLFRRQAPHASEKSHPLWFSAMLPLLPKVELTLLVGAYAQRFHLHGPKQKTLTDAVAHWRDYLPSQLPLPHPSFRNNLWLRQHPWFEEEALPWLQRRVRALTGRQA